ncbi:MAG TPA: ROK family protein [Blastocatellia bacterium]|nr:ROK family protein [Blastocatellia bacterium]
MSEKSRYIGIDLGGTNIKAALVNTDTGQVTDVRSTPTNSRDGHTAVIAQMAELVEEIIAASRLPREKIGGVGMGVPGLLDLEKGTTVFLTNFPGHWRNVPVRDQLAIRINMPVSLLNDARAMTLGEWKFGAGRGLDTACFTLGTGIGGGLVINGRLHLGPSGSAGELGHISVDFNGPKCGCGGRGCIEALASGPAIAALGMKAVVQGRTTIMAEMAGQDLNRITPELVCEAALAGDEIAREIFEFAGRVIGMGVANIVIAVNPRRIVIGGGVAAAGELIMDPIRRSMRSQVFLTDAKQVDVIQAQLGNNAGLIGAAVWARQHRSKI